MSVSIRGAKLVAPVSIPGHGYVEDPTADRGFLFEVLPHGLRVYTATDPGHTEPWHRVLRVYHAEDAPASPKEPAKAPSRPQAPSRRRA